MNPEEKRHPDRPGYAAPMTKSAQDDRPLNMVKVVVFTLVGVGLMVAALSWAAATRRFVARAASAPGMVVRLNAGGAHPEIRFTTSAGQIVEYPQSGMIWDYRVGDQVEVLYDPRSPTDPLINTVGALWGFTLMTFVMGIAFVGVAQLAWRRPDLVN